MFNSAWICSPVKPATHYPYIRPVYTARIYGPYIQVVYTGHLYIMGRIYVWKKLVMQCFSALRAVYTGSVTQAPVYTARTYQCSAATNEYFLCILCRDIAFSALILGLGGRKGIRPVKNWVVGGWHDYLSGVRCRFAYGPADAIATHCLLLQ